MNGTEFHSTTQWLPALLAVTCLSPGSLAQPDCSSPESGCSCRILNTPDPASGIYITELWPGGIVPFDFDAAVTPENRNRVLAAMDTIEAVCDADFVPRVGEVDYVRIFNSNEDSAWVGRRGGQQYVNIRTWHSHFTIVHELIHTLGAWHEHQRADRDAFVAIHTENIPADAGSQRQFEIRAGTTFGWYDFDSVMHYPRYSRTTSGLPTIELRPGYERWTHRLGQLSHLSTGDIWLLAQMYGGARPPGVFDLASPTDGAVLGPAWSPMFTWTASDLATSYRLVVDDDASFATPAIDAAVTETSHAGGMLAGNTLYYWTVFAENAHGTTKPWFTPTGVFFTGETVSPVVYVDDSAPPGGDGASWGAALNDPQDAIALASCAGGAPVEIRIAQGIYTPDRGTGDRHASFILRSSVMIRGGYAGFGAPDPDARDVDAHVTILSGDLAGDDAPGFVSYTENSFHVVSAAGQRAGPAILDGVSVIGGNADTAAWPSTGLGAGLWADDSEVHLIDCTFAASTSLREGAGAYLQACDALLRGCTFTGNRVGATYGSIGGGLATDLGPGTLVLEGCTFSENQAPGGGGAWLRWCTATVRDSGWISNIALTRPGGGLWLTLSDATITSSRFLANTTGNAGGGAAVAFNSHADFANCLFARNTRTNTAASPGGGLWVGDGVGGPASATLTNCTFSQNSSPGAAGGGALGVTQTSTVAAANCIFWGDLPTEIALTGAAAAALSYSDVQGVVWSGPGNISADPLFADSTLSDYRLAAFSRCIDAGNNAAIRPDIMFDLGGLARFHDDPWTPNTGLVDPPRPKLAMIDIGAHEFQRNSCRPDFNDDGFLNSQDFFSFLQDFFAFDADFNADGLTNSQDFFDFLTAFFEGCP